MLEIQSRKDQREAPESTRALCSRCRPRLRGQKAAGSLGSFSGPSYHALWCSHSPLSGRWPVRLKPSTTTIKRQSPCRSGSQAAEAPGGGACPCEKEIRAWAATSNPRSALYPKTLKGQGPKTTGGLGPEAAAAGAARPAAGDSGGCHWHFPPAPWVAHDGQPATGTSRLVGPHPNLPRQHHGRPGLAAAAPATGRWQTLKSPIPIPPIPDLAAGNGEGTPFPDSARNGNRGPRGRRA